MTKLILHIGSHKTGTTTIQKDLFENRLLLEKKGFLYPSYSQFCSKKDHYAHLEIAKSLMGENDKLSEYDTIEFFNNVYDYAKDNNIKNVVISSEPFYRGRIINNEQSIWEQKECYLKKLNEILKFEEIEIILVLRRQDNYLESLYNEHVKVTRYSKDIMSFYNDFYERFSYLKQIKLWENHFPNIKVATFEKMVKSGNISNYFLNMIGLEDSDLKEINYLSSKSNISWPVEIVELKKTLNSSFLSINELNDFRAKISAVDLTKFKKFKFNETMLNENNRKSIFQDHDEDNSVISKLYTDNIESKLFDENLSSKKNYVENIDLKNAIALLYRINFE